MVPTVLVSPLWVRLLEELCCQDNAVGFALGLPLAVEGPGSRLPSPLAPCRVSQQGRRGIAWSKEGSDF